MGKFYFRFGKIPKDGHSTTFVHFNDAVKKEKGVSVYEAHRNINGDWMPVPPSPLNEFGWNDYTMWLYYRWDEVPKYIVSGDIVGKGTDNEPLLKNIRIVEKVTRQKP